jgi:hypothetical protein
VEVHFVVKNRVQNIFFGGYLEVYSFDWRLLSYNLIMMLVSLFFLQEEEEGGRFKTEALKTTNMFQL